MVCLQAYAPVSIMGGNEKITTSMVMSIIMRERDIIKEEKSMGKYTSDHRAFLEEITAKK